MKWSLSFFLMVICTVVLAVQQVSSKKGCNAYGHACYGGHGKRSLTIGGVQNTGSTEQHDGPANAAPVFLDEDINDYPKFRMLKMLKSLYNDHPRRVPRVNDVDYLINDDPLNRDSMIF